MLLGRHGQLIAPNEIIGRIGIVDTEHYRQIVHSLQTKNLFQTVRSKQAAQNKARREKIGIRDVPRYQVVAPESLAPSVKQTIPDENAKGNYPARIHVFDDVEGQAVEVFVGNIPPNTRRRDIYAALQEHGDIQKISLPRGQNKLSKGYAFVEFSNRREAEAAIRKGGSLGGRALRVAWASPPKQRRV